MSEYKCSNCKDKKALFDYMGCYIMPCYLCSDVNSNSNPVWKYEPKKHDHQAQRMDSRNRIDNGDSIIDAIGIAFLFGII